MIVTRCLAQGAITLRSKNTALLRIPMTPDGGTL
jgi:hypothetical protein